MSDEELSPEDALLKQHRKEKKDLQVRKINIKSILQHRVIILLAVKNPSFKEDGK